jgi:Tol biopolymer transport system component
VLGNRKTSVTALILGLAICSQTIVTAKTVNPQYAVTFASFAPLNTDIFVADADGRNPRALLASPALDYNASLSRDGAVAWCLMLR